MAIERITVQVPDVFDPAVPQHQTAVLAKLGQVHGEGWEIESFDPSTKQVTATRQAAITEVVAAASSDSFEVKLARGTKISDGDRVAAKLEDANDGYLVTSFEPYLGKAVLTRLTADEARCRGALAVALGVKPWDLQVSSRRGGGFNIKLPRTFQPGRHIVKLEEVATEVVGRPGWYVKADAQQLVGEIIPGELPTFPDALPTPLTRLGADLDRTPFGRALPAPGEKQGAEVFIDWTAAAFALVAGQPGAGKSVTLNAVIADALAAGSALVIVDDYDKRLDFDWCRDRCRPGGWGCESLGAAVAALGLVLEEGAARAKKLMELGVNNWLDLPKGQRFQPILVVVDELSALLVMDPPLKGVPKDHPLALERAATNLARALLGSNVGDILARLRFVGIRMVLSTQATNANTGVSPSMRTKIGHRILQGTNPSKSARGQIFNDESSTPHVPDNVKAAGKASKGVGVATLEGQAPFVYKSYYASTQAYRDRLDQLGVPTTENPEPTPAQIDRFLPSLEEDLDADPPAKSSRGERAPSGRPAAEVAAEMGDDLSWMYDEDGKRLTGYAKANAARHQSVRGS